MRLVRRPSASFSSGQSRAPGRAAAIGVLALYGAALLSGGASLCYEVVWARALVVPLGNSSDAAALVLGGFMLGMAAGARMGGALSERWRSPLVLYALTEAALAVYGATVPSAFASLSSLGTGSGAWGLAIVARFAAALALVALPSVGMGATFPLLVRALARPPAVIRTRVGLAYAINTGGAAAGAIATGFIAIPALGVSACSVVAAAAQLTGAALLLVAHALRRPLAVLAAGESAGDVRRGDVPRNAPDAIRDATNAVRDAAEVTPSPTGPACASTREAATVAPSPATAALVGAFVCGFAMIACETLWARVLTFVFGHDTYAFATLVAVVLLGLALGGVVQRIAARVRQALLLGIVVSLFAACVLASFWWAAAAVVHLGRDPFHLDAMGGLATSAWLELFRELAYAPLLVLLPALLSGAAYAAACSTYADGAVDIGRKTGVVALANGLGSALGALVSALGLVTVAGIQGSFVLIAAVTSVAGAWVLFTATPRRWRAASAMGAPLAVAVLWAFVPAALPRQMLLQAVGARHQDLLHYEEGRTGTVSVIQNQINGEKQLVMNAVNEVTTRLVHDQSFKLLGHLGPLLHPHPRHGVMICLGAGLSAGAALAHPLEWLDVIDLSSAVARGARHFADENRQVLDDPRLRLHIGDGRQFLLNTPSRYDVAIIDSTHPKSVDSWILYTKEFYELVRARLADGGIVVQWLPLHGLSEREFQIVVRTFYEAFPQMTLWANAGFETYGHVGYAKLVGTRGDLLPIDYARLAARLEDPVVRHDLLPFGMARPEEILDLFVAEPDDIARWTQGVPWQSDDHPLLPYTTAFSSGRRMEPSLLLAVRSPAGPWLHAVGSDESTVRAAVQRAYETQGLVLAGQLERAAELDPSSTKIPLFVSQTRTTRPYYAALGARYLDDPDKLFESASQLASMGFAAEARPILDRALSIRPEDVRLRVQRALLLSDAGEHAEAVALLTRLHHEIPSSALVSYDLGAALLASGQPEAAAAHLRAAVADDPDRVGAWLQLSDAEARLGNFDRARQALDRVVARHPWVAEAHDRLGQLAELREETARAMDHHREAVRLSPYRAAFHEHLGGALERAGALEAAEAAYARALRISPNDAPVLRRLGVLLARRGELELAGERLLRGLELDPHDAQGVLELGRVLGRQGKRVEAIGALCLALRLDRRLEPARYELSRLHAELDDCSNPAGAD